MIRNLKNGGWLDDQHIQLAQDLLREQFPTIDGLQSTLLGQNDGFIPVQREGIGILDSISFLMCVLIITVHACRYSDSLH